MSVFEGAASEKQTVRRPAVAGQFYSADPDELRNDIKSYLKAGDHQGKYSQFLISPHAGYMFSGAVAGMGYATVNPAVKRVFIVGPSHHKWFEGVSIPEFDAYDTPLGRVGLAKGIIRGLREHSFVHAHTDAHGVEHCLEVQIPFLQTVLDSFEIIPILCGRVNPARVAEILNPLIDDTTLVVASSDLSHYHSDEEAREIDAQSLETIKEGRIDGHLDACGETPIRIILKLTSDRGLSAQIADARNSFQVAPYFGSRQRVVGYASVIFTASSKAGNKAGADSIQTKITGKDKHFLLSLARKSLDSSVRGEQIDPPDSISGFSEQHSGLFVTLTLNGRLRGCIGYIEGVKPLYQAVVENARNAALGDPRFPNVRVDELEHVVIELSVLTRPVKLEYSNPQDLLDQLRVGHDGLILQKGYRQSTFLPQVWDSLPEKVQFLEHLAMKAGLSKDDWKVAEYKRYQAIHFQEE